MNLFMRSGPQSDVQYVDGLKIGTTTRSSFATGIIILRPVSKYSWPKYSESGATDAHCIFY